MNKTRLVLLFFAAAVLAGCSSTPRRAAPVVEQGTSHSPKANEAVAKPKAADARGYYTVKKGDTLYRIALDHGQNYRDLVAWNNLSSPNDIKVDQVLRVLPPETAAGQTGPQTGSIAASSGVEVRPLGSAAPAPAASAGANKTSPRGDKRPYSESALAELQKPDGTPALAASASAASTPATETSKAAASKPKESATEEAGAASAAAADESINWMWPAEGKIVATFSGGKKGIDIAGKMGQPIYAAGTGTVLYASSVRGYGNLVIVKHTNNLLSAYAHNKTILVKEGQSVSKGQKIAEMGNSDSETIKLHFEIRQQGKPVDPSKFLPAR